MTNHQIRDHLIYCVQNKLENVPFSVSNARICSVKILTNKNKLAIIIDDPIYGKIYFAQSLYDVIRLKVNYMIDARILATDIGYSTKEYPNKMIFGKIIKLHKVKIV